MGNCQPSDLHDYPKSHDSVRKNNWQYPFKVLSRLFLICCLAAISSSSPAFSKDKKQVLVIYTYHQALESIEQTNRGIRSVLRETRQPDLEVHTEYIDARRVSNNADKQYLADFLRQKYRSNPFHLIISSGDAAYNFCREFHNSLFPRVPIVFCGVHYSQDSQGQMGLDDLMSGVVESIDLPNTLAAALRLQPETSRVIVINDFTNPSLGNRQSLEQALAKFANRVKIEYLENLEMAKVLERVRSLSPGDIILLMSFTRDKSGKVFDPNQSLALIAKESAVPIYSFWDFYLGKGIVGGMLVDHTEHGRIAGERALEILSGKAAPGALKIIEGPNRYMFDFFEMQIHKLKLANLPKDSIVINAPPTSYAINKPLVWTAVSSIASLAVIIAVLMMNIRRRRRAEEAVRESEEKYRTLVNNLNIGVYRNTLEKEGAFLQVNPAMAKIFGYDSPEELMGVNTIDLYQDPEDRKAFLKEVMRQGFVQNRELALRKKDGTPIWCSASSTVQCDSKGEVKWIDGVMEDISERKNAAEVFQETHQKLWALIQSSPFSISVQDPEGRVLMWNPASETVFGWTEEEVLGRDMPTIPPDKREEFLDNLGRSIAGRPIKGMEIQRQRKDGSLVDVCLYTAPLYDTKGRATSCMALQVDITEQKKADLALKKAHEELEARVEARTIELLRANDQLQQEIEERKRTELELQKTKEYLENVFDTSAEALTIVNRKGRFVLWNKRATEMVGYRFEELSSKSAFDLYADPQEMEKMLEILRKEGVVRGYEILMKKKDGSLVSVEVSISILKDEHGEVMGSVCMTRDLSAAKLAMAEMQRVNAQLLQEIADRQKAEERLRQAHAEIEQLFASITSILIGLSPTGEIWHWNEEAEKVLGIAAAEALRQNLRELPVHWDKAKISGAIEDCRKQSQPVKVENVRFQRRDGKDGFLGISISPIKEKGNISGLILLGSDVTERLILEMQLAQSQKLESIGQLAAGIAHEINTPIQYVGDNTRFLKDAFKDLSDLLEQYQGLLKAGKAGAVDSALWDQVENVCREIDLEYLVTEIPAAINQSLDGVDRVAKIVGAMKEFSHPGTVEKQAVDLNKAIESTVTVARNEWKYVADVVLDLDPFLPLVPCRPDELNQVFLNIIINAAHAIAEKQGREPSEKGTITVKTRKNGSGVEIFISDTGGGIPEGIRSRIFDPFFTTKEVGKGTGQGLAISHSVIVEKHGGTINFETALGQGTTFIIHLPGETSEPQ
jgi:PAS domain S-box-containing protein